MRRIFLYLIFIMGLSMAAVAQSPTDTVPGSLYEWLIFTKEAKVVNLPEVKAGVRVPKSVLMLTGTYNVVVSVSFDATGRYQSHTLLKDPHAELTAAVLREVHLLRATPAEVEGRPSPSRVTVPFRFVLEGGACRMME